MQTQQIPFSKLRLSPANARKSFSQAGVEALAISIDAYGLLQPVIVSPAPDKKSLFYVHAGGRRWRAIAKLIESGELPKNATVDARVCNDETAALAEEISMAENLIREAMSPADECSGYRAIIEKGATEEDVARRFGVTVRHVQGRLRLADLAEPIFNALAASEITLDVAKAYGSTPDRDAQLASWNYFNGHSQGTNPMSIRRHLAGNAIDATSAVALLVGEDDYVAAGGRIERDLFAGDGEGKWLDSEIAETIAIERLEREAEAIAIRENLPWVRPVLATHVPYEATETLRDYYRPRVPLSDEAQARMTEIGERLQAIEEEIDEAPDQATVNALEIENAGLESEYDELSNRAHYIPEEDRPHVGTFLLINAQGEPVLSPRYYSTAPAKRATATPKTSKPGEPGTIDDTLPRGLEEHLAKDRRDVLALHVAQDPSLALDLTIFGLARRFTGQPAYNDTGVMVMIGELFDPGGLSGVPLSTALEELEAVRTALPGEWAAAENSFAAFLAFRALDEADKAAWLAYAVSRSLKASLTAGGHANAFQTGLGALLEIDTAAYWRPGPENFFDRIRKPQILSILGGLDPELPGRYASAKKSELSSTAAKLCSGEAIVTPEVKARALGWIPDVMSFTAADTPGEPETAPVNDDRGKDHAPIDNGGDEDVDDTNPGVNDVAAADEAMAEAA